ncbi:hypothetical protein AGMMS4956_00570 [Bacteroidia bacterium]|nr:hypothetical protein AGMMS4956_00570 [Bacteroidia bacterium]
MAQKQNIERPQAVKDFINEHQMLFWYSPEPKSETVSDELVVETLINYGTMNDIHRLFDTMGLQYAANIFRGMTGRKKMNFYPELWNYFNLYFDKYVCNNS